MYRRNKFRPPRQIEETALSIECSELRARLDAVLDESAELRRDNRMLFLQVEQLTEHKIRLASELSQARNTLRFMKGEPLEALEVRKEWKM